MGPHCVPPLPPSFPVFPLCRERGFWRVLCHKLHKNFSQTTIQGFLFCKVSRRWLPALPRILLWTKHLGDRGTLVASSGFQVPPPAVPSQDLEADSRGIWGQGRHLPESSGLLPLPLRALGRDIKGRSPPSTPDKPRPEHHGPGGPGEACMPPAHPTARSTLRLSRPSCSADHSFSLCRGRHPFPQEAESGGREERALGNAVKDLGMGKAEGSRAPPYPITQPLFSRVLPTTVSDVSLINGGDQIGGGGSSSQRTDST